MADKQYKLAFDVSTNNTGVALLDENNTIVASHEIKTNSQHPDFGTRMALDLPTIEKNLMSMDGVFTILHNAHKEYQDLLNRDLSKAVDKGLTPAKKDLLKAKGKRDLKTWQKVYDEATKIKKEAWEKAEKIELIVVIETNKIDKSQDVKQKLDLYVGMYLATVVSTLDTLCPYFQKFYKLSSPTEWRIKSYGYEPERKEAKALAIEMANELLKDQGDTTGVSGHDEAEAIIIATVADSLRDIATVYTQKQHKAKRLQQLKNKLGTAERIVAKYEIIKHEKEKVGKKLQKSQQTVFDNNLIKVKEVKAEIKKLNSL